MVKKSAILEICHDLHDPIESVHGPTVCDVAHCYTSDDESLRPTVHGHEASSLGDLSDLINGNMEQVGNNIADAIQAKVIERLPAVIESATPALTKAAEDAFGEVVKSDVYQQHISGLMEEAKTAKKHGLIALAVTGVATALLTWGLVRYAGPAKLSAQNGGSSFSSHGTSSWCADFGGAGRGAAAGRPTLVALRLDHARAREASMRAHLLFGFPCLSVAPASSSFFAFQSANPAIWLRYSGGHFEKGMSL